VQEIKTAGAWVKKELKLILPKIKTKIFEYHFCSNFQDKHFLFYDYVHLSNVKKVILNFQKQVLK
jgi:hypothetical protein